MGKDYIISMGHRYDIKYVEEHEEGVAGQVDWDNDELIVTTDEDAIKQMNTLLHEGLHTLWRRAELYQIVSGEAEEIIISNFCNFISENFFLKLRKRKIKYKP